MQIKLCWQHNFICIICYFYVFMPRKNKPKCSDNEKQSISRINTFLNKKLNGGSTSQKRGAAVVD